MPNPAGKSYGRAATVGVLLALLLTITAGVYVFAARFGQPSLAIDAVDPVAQTRHFTRLTLLLTILLASVLLVLLFVIGSYFVIRLGKILRTPVGGTPTPYVDAWRSYRVTDEEIAQATAEDEPEVGPDAPKEG
jgi:hypothetical protein